MDKIKQFIHSTNTLYGDIHLAKNHNDILLKQQYFKWIKILHQMQHTRQYRRIISEIEIHYSKYQSLHNDIYIIHIIKAQCILKIISHKLNKYYIELSTKKYFQTHSLLFWFNYLFLNLEQLVLLFREEHLSQECNLNKIEQVVQIHLDTLYHLALFDKSKNNITQMCTYFAMVDNIKYVFNYCRHPRTLNLYRKLYLLRAVTLIMNQDYDNSLKYQKLCVDICFREFFLVVDFDEGLEEVKQVNKVITVKNILKRNCIDLVIAFYLRGVCYEYLGDLQKSIEAYKQIRWFSNKFLHEREPGLTLFCERLEKRALLYYELLSNVYKDKVKIETKRKQKETKRNMQIKQRLLSCNNKNIISNEMYTFKKDLNNSNSIECSFADNVNSYNYNIKGKNPKTQYIMSTMKLINTLLEKDYMPILNEMNTIEINKYDKEINNKIFNRKYEISSKRNQHSLIKSSSQSLVLSNPNISTSPINNNITTYRYKLKQNPNISYHSFSSKVQKLKFDNEQFSKEYLNKRNYLEKVNKKETAFLKKVLECKKIERNFHISFPDPNKMAKEAQNAFSLGLSLARTTDNRTALQKLIENTKLNDSENRYQYMSVTAISKRSIGSYIGKKNIVRKACSMDGKNEKEIERNNEDKGHSLSQDYFHLRRNVPPDLSNSNIVNKLNNDMIKKLNLEYEILSQKGNSLTEKRSGCYYKEGQKEKSKKGRSSLLKTYLQNVNRNKFISKNNYY